MFDSYVQRPSLTGTTQNPSPEYESCHILHPHHDALHSYSHSYAQLFNTPMMLGLSDRIHIFLSDHDGDTQFMHRKLRK